MDASRVYLQKRLAYLVSSLSQIHREIELVNNVLREMDAEIVPQPLGGLKSAMSVRSASSSATRPKGPVTPNYDDVHDGLVPTDGKPKIPIGTDSYFPAIGMEAAHTIPPQMTDSVARKKPALGATRSEADLRGNRPPTPLVHPAHRPSVSGQSRYPILKKFGYKDS